MFVALEHHLAPDAAPRSSRLTSATPDPVPQTLSPIREDAHERKTAPSVFSNLRTLFPAQNLQPSPFQSLPHSFVHHENTTLPFPVTSALFLRSFAQERKLTRLFSCACALFCEKWGCHEKFGSLLDCQSSGLSTIFTILAHPAAQTRSVSKRTAMRLNRVGHPSALMALWHETLCYALRLEEPSAAPSEVPCGF
jgi:hypothetical protein